jgi:hypothetical protein
MTGIWRRISSFKVELRLSKCLAGVAVSWKILSVRAKRYPAHGLKMTLNLWIRPQMPEMVFVG